MQDERRPSLESTHDLVARARSGDEAAYDALFTRHFAPLRRWTTGRLPRWARKLTDTDDLVQTALLQTFKRLDTFEPRGPGALQAYLRQAVLNKLRDELRKHGRQPEVLALDDTGAAAALGIEGGESPLASAVGAENLARYQQALRRLRAEEREAIIGRVEMGYTFPELADLLGKPSADAARKATERALVRLAEEMSRER